MDFSAYRKNRQVQVCHLPTRKIRALGLFFLNIRIPSFPFRSAILVYLVCPSDSQHRLHWNRFAFGLQQ